MTYEDYATRIRREEQEKRDANTLRATALALKTLEERAARERGEHPEQTGQLVEHVTYDDTGRKIRTFTGPKRAWMDVYKMPGFYGRFHEHGWGKK
jgi:hypothetical protein